MTSRKIELVLGEALEGVAGVAHINTPTMQALGVGEGDLIEVAQSVTFSLRTIRLKAAKALPEDEDKNMVRIGKLDVEIANLKVGKKCHVHIPEEIVAR